MENITFITYSGSRYSIDQKGYLLRNNKRWEDILYLGLVNTLQHYLHGTVTPDRFGYEPVEEIKKYIEKHYIRNNGWVKERIDSGICPSQCISIVGISEKAVEKIKKSLEITSSDMSEFAEKLRTKVELMPIPEGMIKQVPHTLVTKVVLGYELV